MGTLACARPQLGMLGPMFSYCVHLCSMLAGSRANAHRIRHLMEQRDVRCRRGEPLQYRLTAGNNMRLVICALVVLLASHGAAARSWPLPLEVGEPCPVRTATGNFPLALSRASSVVIGSQDSHGHRLDRKGACAVSPAAGAEHLQASVASGLAVLFSNSPLSDRTLLIAVCSLRHAVLFTQGAQARQPLLRLARQLLGIGADGERQWKDGTACARDADCGSGLCADKVRTDRRLCPAVLSAHSVRLESKDVAAADIHAVEKVTLRRAKQCSSCAGLRAATGKAGGWRSMC